MRYAVILGSLATGLFGLGLLADGAKAEFFCSPGFEPIGGRCVATISRSQVDLYLNEPVYAETRVVERRVVRHHYRRHRHTVRARY